MTDSQTRFERKIFDRLTNQLQFKYNISIFDILKIIEYCFAGELIPTVKELNNKNKHLDKFISRVLDINYKELIKAFNRTVPKLKEIDKLMEARKFHGSYDPYDLATVKEDDGVHRQAPIKGDLENE